MIFTELIGTVIFIELVKLHVYVRSLSSDGVRKMGPSGQDSDTKMGE